MDGWGWEFDYSVQALNQFCEDNGNKKKKARLILGWYQGHSMSNQHEKLTTPMDFSQIW